MIGMRGWLASLVEWCSLPVIGGFTELDEPIDKLRTLRDSYQVSLQESRYSSTGEMEKDENHLLTVS